MKIIETIALTESDLHGRSRSIKKYSKEETRKKLAGYIWKEHFQTRYYFSSFLPERETNEICKIYLAFVPLNAIPLNFNAARITTVFDAELSIRNLSPWNTYYEILQMFEYRVQTHSRFAPLSMACDIANCFSSPPSPFLSSSPNFSLSTLACWCSLALWYASVNRSNQ